MTICQTFFDVLVQNDHAVDWCKNGQRVIAFALHEQYDLALLDIGLLMQSGLNVLLSWRDKELNFPVIMITAREAMNDKVYALSSVADDYLVKPFAMEE